jgi:hypothetical protein
MRSKPESRPESIKRVKIARIVVNPLQVMVSGNERKACGPRVVVPVVGNPITPAAPWPGAKQLTQSSPILS